MSGRWGRLSGINDGLARRYWRQGLIEPGRPLQPAVRQAQIDRMARASGGDSGQPRQLDERGGVVRVDRYLPILGVRPRPGDDQEVILVIPGEGGYRLQRGDQGGGRTERESGAVVQGRGQR